LHHAKKYAHMSSSICETRELKQGCQPKLLASCSNSDRSRTAATDRLQPCCQFAQKTTVYTHIRVKVVQFVVAKVRTVAVTAAAAAAAKAATAAGLAMLHAFVN